MAMPKKMSKKVSKKTSSKPTRMVNNKDLELGEIQKDAPLPTGFASSRGPHITYPTQYQKVDSMEIGDSITFPNTKEYVLMVNAIRIHLRKTSEKNFIMRKISNEAQGIWRVEPVRRKRKFVGNRYQTVEEAKAKAAAKQAKS